MPADSTTVRTALDDRAADILHLARWTVTSGSNTNSRGAVVIAAGDHQCCRPGPLKCPYCLCRQHIDHGCNEFERNISA